VLIVTIFRVGVSNGSVICRNSIFPLIFPSMSFMSKIVPFGGVWIVNNFWTTSTTNRLATITTNDIFKVPVGLLGGSTTIAFRIPRVGDLTNSGSKWWVFMGVQGWEDYGLDTACPTYNGHLRDIGPYASQYNFRATDGNLNVAKFVDLVIKNPSNQANICSNRIIDASDMFEITLP